jgi:hypothetical protein
MRHFFMIFIALYVTRAAAGANTIECRKPPAASIEALACRDAEMMTQDRATAAVWRQH